MVGCPITKTRMSVFEIGRTIEADVSGYLQCRRQAAERHADNL